MMSNHLSENEIVGSIVGCDRCGDVISIDGKIQLGYAVYEVEDDPKTCHYLCAMCDDIWRTYYLMVGWVIKKEILIIEPN